MKPESFLKMAKKCGVRWALFLRDPTHCWYQRGLQEGDADGFMTVLTTLQVGHTLPPPKIPLREHPPTRARTALLHLQKTR